MPCRCLKSTGFIVPFSHFSHISDQISFCQVLSSCGGRDMSTFHTFWSEGGAQSSVIVTHQAILRGIHCLA